MAGSSALNKQPKEYDDIMSEVSEVSCRGVVTHVILRKSTNSDLRGANISPFTNSTRSHLALAVVL